MNQKYPVILSSGSPRRKMLLENSGIDFYAYPTDADESTGLTNPADVVQELSYRKARAAYEEIFAEKKTSFELKAPGYIVLGSDTVVALDDKILGKPSDEEDALNTLMSLQGRNHSVYTGLSFFVCSADGKISDSYRSYEKSDVFMREFTKEEAIDYVKTKEPLDKAGSYGIQGIGGRLVSGIKGDYNTIVGFPLCKFIEELIKRGLIYF